MSKKTFENMSKPEQRVAIAEDVLKQIHAGKIYVRRGVYLSSNTAEFDEKTKSNCSACALGVMFVAKYNLVNCDWFYNMGQRRLQVALKDYFSIFQLRKIERAFECSWSWIDDSEDCLIAIMQNIIDHDGKFHTSVKYEMA